MQNLTPAKATVDAANSKTLAERCRAAGLKATPQRIAVLRSLVLSDQHPSPESTYSDVRISLPSISRGTVYKTLETLEEAGLIQQVAVRFETKRYDGKLHDHHHLICTECNCVVDIDESDLLEEGKSQMVSLDARAFGGFVASKVHLQIMGVCAACSEKTPEKTA